MKPQTKSATCNSFAPSKIIWPLLTLTIMMIIFYFSSQNDVHSSMQSQTVLEFVRPIIEPFVPVHHRPNLEHIIRKTAHFTIYFALGLCLYQSLKAWLDGKSRMALFCLALLMAFLYACSDELHQLFVSGRAGQFADVLLDSSGAAIGAGLVCLFSGKKASS